MAVEESRYCPIKRDNFRHDGWTRQHEERQSAPPRAVSREAHLYRLAPGTAVSWAIVVGSSTDKGESIKRTRRILQHDARSLDAECVISLVKATIAAS